MRVANGLKLVIWIKTVIKLRFINPWSPGQNDWATAQGRAYRSSSSLSDFHVIINSNEISQSYTKSVLRERNRKLSNRLSHCSDVT